MWKFQGTVDDYAMTFTPIGVLYPFYGIIIHLDGVDYCIIITVRALPQPLDG